VPTRLGPLPHRLWLAATAFWILILAGGWYALLRKDFTPGSEGRVPERWPVESSLPLDGGRQALLLFAHRSCPCTRTTLGELEQILAQGAGRFHARVVFLAPPSAREDRVGRNIERLARSLPGVEMVLDPEGALAKQFHVRTSGHVVLYGRDGRLLFSGGITDARGHAGESAGRRAVLAALRGEASERRNTPVYGCSLFGEAEEGEGEGMRWE
jgi:hypothetical protein